MAASKLEQKLLGILSMVLVAITVAMCFLVTYFPNVHNVAVSLKDTWYMSGNTSSMSIIAMLKETPDSEMVVSAAEMLNGHQIRFQLPVGMKEKNVEVLTSPMDCTVTVKIDGLKSNYIYDYPMIGTGENVVDIIYDNYDEVANFVFQLDDVCEPIITREDRFIYLDFVDPHEIYDYVVVLDAGHGGDSVGAVKDEVYEKDINLEMLLCAKEVFDANPYNIKVYYTKTDDTNPSYASRVNLANYTDADAYISIHSNSTSTGRTSDVNGTEVMYRGSDTTGESKRFAEVVLKNVTGKLGSTDKGTVVGDEVYIIRTAEVPVALVEVGFMTNPNELGKLQDHDYQMKLAEGLYESVLEYLEIK